ncbi:DNA-binding transcriptional MerR regulator [Thermocatellispora tengchongensis]|uniref:DNA-binding transcriptional MerR regulator n=1 Tax=Thermocatellispora tengchongensis TaxID=1073253 RepID=A0A840P8P1_9ACTN|nr:MerR family transcriptional regulator [Thermocatellispora tengchongensis]MBB5134986.1 DNA-binding transcriptional MerR regulator [Thermocatellispora tengchongensis]
MDDNELYPIGDVARRTGLSVSAIRYYSDAGIIAPTRVTEAGYRLYDIRAIARLELIRTLRDLDAGLDDIRRVLEGETSLHDLLAAHLELIERQERDLRARRAVLRTLVKQGGTAAQAALMHKLVSMPDEERERLIDDFWHEVGENLDVPSGFVERLRAMRPRLPEDPTATQLEAWIELAELVQDEEFRGAVRSYLQDMYATFPGRSLATPSVWDFIHKEGAKIGEEIVEAYRSGLPADSPRAQELVVRMAEATAEVFGGQVTAGSRDRMARAYLLAEEMRREDSQEQDRYDATHGRYLSLVAVINGTPHSTDAEDPAVFGWIAAALRASARRGGEPGTPE